MRESDPCEMKLFTVVGCVECEHADQQMEKIKVGKIQDVQIKETCDKRYSQSLFSTKK